MHVYELNTLFDYRKSFYGKAVVEGDPKTGDLTLKSYGTKVAVIEAPRFHGEERKLRVFGTYSVTTLRHIKEFMRQNGYPPLTKNEIVETYCVR